MNHLVQCLTPLVHETLSQPDWYNWPLPKYIPKGITLPDGSRLDQTRALKSALSRMYVEQSAQRYELSEYFVASWGQVRRNSPATLERYVTEEPQVIIQTWQGISSWSKVLHLRYPTTYYIYDARIAVLLNLMQIDHAQEGPLFFPIPNSQNQVIKRARQRLMQVARLKSWPRARPHMYNEYNAVLKDVAEQVGTVAEIVEMVLFSRAPSMAASWIVKA